MSLKHSRIKTICAVVLKHGRSQSLGKEPDERHAGLVLVASVVAQHAGVKEFAFLNPVVELRECVVVDKREGAFADLRFEGVAGEEVAELCGVVSVN